MRVMKIMPTASRIQSNLINSQQKQSFKGYVEDLLISSDVREELEKEVERQSAQDREMVDYYNRDWYPCRDANGNITNAGSHCEYEPIESIRQRVYADYITRTYKKN